MDWERSSRFSLRILGLLSVASRQQRSPFEEISLEQIESEVTDSGDLQLCVLCVSVVSPSPVQSHASGIILCAFAPLHFAFGFRSEIFELAASMG